MSSTMQTSTLVDNGLIPFKPQDMQGIVINFLRAQNQKKSPLLKLPNELIIQIGKLVFDSDGPTRVHGMLSRNNFERNPIFLIQTCSLLRSVLQPIFLNVSAFVLKVASPTSIEVASKISKWSTTFYCATTKDVITPKIFIEITPGFGSMDAVAVNCAKHAESLAQTPTFRPKVFFNIRGATGLAYFVGSAGMMRLHPPPTDVIMRGVSNPFLYGTPPPGDWDAWKGWVATNVDDEDIMRWQHSRCKKHGGLEIFWEDDQKRLKRCTGIDAN